MSSVQGFQPQEISTHSGENFKNLYHSSPNCHETMDAETKLFALGFLDLRAVLSMASSEACW